ncbi:MAG: protease modulator HflC [Desulfatibacillaceae bacterium]
MVKNIVIVAIAICLLGLYMSVYVVDEREQVVIKRFGKIIGEAITEPGLGFKVPVVDQVIRFPKNLQNWDGEPGQVPTRDKTFIWVDSFARWRIVDPALFYRSVGGDLRRALDRLDDIIDPAVRNAITSHHLIETVRWTDRSMDTFETTVADIAGEEQPPIMRSEDQPAMRKVKMGRQEITRSIRKAASEKMGEFGIEILDVKLKRINYRKEVRDAVYNRMIAERKQIAEKFRSEGRGEAQEIRGEMERDLKQIQSEAYRTAQEIKGKADAEATAIYAKAYNPDPEFYSFMKTLDIYRESLSKDSSVILSTDSEFFKYLKELKGRGDE